METVIYSVIIYVSFFVVLFGGVWVCRRITKSLRRRRIWKQDAEEYARNTEAYLKDIGHNKQTLGQLIKTVTKKSEYN